MVIASPSRSSKGRKGATKPVRYSDCPSFFSDGSISDYVGSDIEFPTIGYEKEGNTSFASNDSPTNRSKVDIEDKKTHESSPIVEMGTSTTITTAAAAAPAPATEEEEKAVGGNTNNNVLSPTLRTTRSAMETSISKRSALPRVHPKRQNRKGRATTDKSVTSSVARLQLLDNQNVTSCEIVRRSKSCTAACDIMKAGSIKPYDRDFDDHIDDDDDDDLFDYDYDDEDDDDSDLNMYYVNFTSGSVSLDDFSCSVSSRNFDDDDDDNNNDDDVRYIIGNDKDNENDDDDEEEDGKGVRTSANDDRRQSRVPSHFDIFLVQNENNPGGTSLKMERSARKKDGRANPSISYILVDDTLEAKMPETVSVVAPYCSLATEGPGQGQGSASESLLTNAPPTISFPGAAAAADHSMSTTLTLSDDSLGGPTTESGDIYKPESNSSSSTSCKKMGDFFQDESKTEQAKSEMVVMSSEGFEVVEISLDGMANSDEKHTNTPVYSPCPQGRDRFSPMNVLGHGARCISSTPVDDQDTNRNDEDDNGTETSFNVESLTLTSSPSQSIVVKSSTKDATNRLTDITEESTQLGRVTSLSASEFNQDHGTPRHDTISCVTPTHSPDDEGSTTRLSDEKMPLPLDIANAIRRAVAKGVFDDAKSVEVDGNDYSPRCASDSFGVCALEKDNDESLGTFPNRIERSGRSGDINSENRSSTSMSMPSGVSAKICKNNDKSHCSISDIKVFSVLNGKESCYQHREYNDICHLGKNIDVMCESVSLSPCEKKSPAVEGGNVIEEIHARRKIIEHRLEGKQEDVDEKRDPMDKGIQNKTPACESNEDEIYFQSSEKADTPKYGQNTDSENVGASFDEDCIHGTDNTQGENQKDGMEPAIKSEASGDFIADMAERKTMHEVRHDKKGAVHSNSNGNKLETESVSSLKSCHHSSNEETGKGDHMLFDQRPSTSTEHKQSESDLRLEAGMEPSSKHLANATNGGETKSDPSSSRIDRARSKSEFLSLLLNMMDDDRDPLETAAASPKKRKDPEPTTTSEAEPDVESGGEKAALSFPRGIDSIEPNDNTWWQSAREELETSYRQARRARRRLMLMRSRMIGRGKKKGGGSPEPATSEQSLSPPVARLRQPDVFEEGSESCTCCYGLSMSKEMRQCMSRMHIKLVDRQADVPSSRQDAMMTYVKAAESFVKPDHQYTTRMFNKYGECECDEDGANWMDEGRTPFSQAGDRYSLLEEYYSRKSEVCSYNFQPGIGDQTSNVFESESSTLSLNNVNSQSDGGLHLGKNSARISKRRFHAPSVMESERLKRLSLDDNEEKPVNFNIKHGAALCKTSQILEELMEDDDDSSSSKGKFYNTKWRSKTTPKISAAIGFEGVKDKFDQRQLETRDSKRTRYVDLLHTNAKIEIESLEKMGDEKLRVKRSEGVTKANLDSKGKKKKKKETMVKVVRFADVGVRTIKCRENQWNSTVNEMLLKSEKVKEFRGSSSLDEMDGPKYPRSQSANKVSAVPERTFNFLNELLEADIQEQQMSTLDDTSSTYAANVAANSKLGFHMSANSLNLPPIYTTNRLRPFDDKQSGVYIQTPILTPYKPHEQPLVRAHDAARCPVNASSRTSHQIAASRKPGRHSNCSGLKRTISGNAEVLNPKPPADTDRTEELWYSHTPKRPMPKPHCSPRPKKWDVSHPLSNNSFQLGRYSDVFDYYVSPHLRDRTDTSIVQMYQK